MKIDIDKEHGLAYITLVKESRIGEACQQVRCLHTDIVLDLDTEGRLLGIELLNLKLLHPDLAEGDVVETHAR